MRIRDHQMHPRQTTCLQPGQELTPKIERLTVADCRTEYFASSLDRDTGRHDQSLGDHMRPDPDLAVRGIKKNVGKARVRQRPLPEAGNLDVEAAADP